MRREGSADPSSRSAESVAAPALPPPVRRRAFLPLSSGTALFTAEFVMTSTMGGMVHALLIEDDRKLASLLREFLGQHGVEATWAEDSTHALRELSAQRFDIL